MGRTAAWVGFLSVAALAFGGSLAAAAYLSQPGEAAAPAPTVAFYGDSYTLGTGASDSSLRWSTVVSEQRRWNEYNPSVNGLGFVNNRGVTGPGDLPSRIIEADPDIVIVAMGLNDNFSYESRGDDIKAAIDADFDRLSTELPDAEFIVVEPFWYTDQRPESVDTIAGWVREAAERIGAPYIEGASRWLEGRPELMAEDGLHPNDAGYAEMAKRMDEALRELGY